MPRRPAPTPRVLLPVAEDRDGAPVMVWDRVAETLRLGAFLEDAAARSGLTAGELTRWVRDGIRVRASLSAGQRLPQTVTDEEQGWIRTAAAVEQAEAEGKVFLLGLLERVSRGGEVVITTEKVGPDGSVVERVTRTERLAPDAATVRWRLERRWPEQYGKRSAVELTGPDGGPVRVSTDDRAAELAKSLRDRLAHPSAAPTNGAANGHR